MMTMVDGPTPGYAAVQVWKCNSGFGSPCLLNRAATTRPSGSGRTTPLAHYGLGNALEGKASWTRGRWPGHPREWTCEDLGAARLQANQSSRP